MLRRSLTWYIKLKNSRSWQGLFARKISVTRSVPDRGLGGEPHAGDQSLTDPRMYRSGTAAGAIRAHDALHDVARWQVMGRNTAAVGAERAAALEEFDNPRTSAEQQVADRHDQVGIGLRGAFQEEESLNQRYKTGRSAMAVRGVENPVTTKLVHQMQRGEKVRERTYANHPILPNAVQYGALERKLKQQEHTDLEAEKLRDRLAMEHGIFGRDRIDAYMLDDETIFPNWAKQLHSTLRTKVLYGALGLTEEDEAIRQNLAQLSTDDRRAEWARIKAAKSYELGEETRLTPAQVRKERVANRNFKWLYRKRLNREGMVRRLAMKAPDRYGKFPATRGIDLSHRLAVVAQHIQSKVKTEGQWPLDESRLHSAKQRMERNQLRESFLSKPSADQAFAIDRVSPALKEAVKRIGASERPVKRISRKQYAFRLQAVKDGNQDEHGRRYQDISRRSRQRELVARTMPEFERERQQVAAPNLREGDKNPHFLSLAARYDGKNYAFAADPREGA